MSMDVKRSGNGFWPTDYSMKLLLKEIASHQVLSKEVEQYLFQRYSSSVDPHERQVIKSKIINANMRFVLKIALSYRSIPGADVLDLVSEGKFGLLNAVELFDWKTNNKFISFAVWHIRAKVSKYLESSDLIRIPSQKKIKLNKIKKERNCEEFDNETFRLYQITNQISSIDAPVTDGENSFSISETLQDETIEPFDSKIIQGEVSEMINKMFSTILNKEEIIVLKCLYGLGRDELGLKDTKYIIGKSHERVRQIRDRAFSKLKRYNLLDELKSLVLGNSY